MDVVALLQIHAGGIVQCIRNAFCFGYHILVYLWTSWRRSFPSSLQTNVSVWEQAELFAPYLLHLSLLKILFKFGLCCSLPWDQSTALGYFGEILVISLNSQAFMLADGATLLFFLSLCFHHIAFYKMFKHSIAKLDDVDQNQQNKLLLCRVIRFHVVIKE